MRTSRLATLSVVFLLGTLAVPSSPAETPRPVKWTLSAETEENLPLRKGATVVAQLRATIDSGWHLYSLDQEPGGPTATKIKVADGQAFKIHGDIDQPTPISALDPNFNLETHFYEREVTFKIPLTVATSVKSKQPVLSIDVLYQTCNGTTCLPPTVAHVTAEVNSQTPRARGSNLCGHRNASIVHDRSLESSIEDVTDPEIPVTAAVTIGLVSRVCLRWRPSRKAQLGRKTPLLRYQFIESRRVRPTDPTGLMVGGWGRTRKTFEFSMTNDYPAAPDQAQKKGGFEKQQMGQVTQHRFSD